MSCYYAAGSGPRPDLIHEGFDPISATPEELRTFGLPPRPNRELTRVLVLVVVPAV